MLSLARIEPGLLTLLVVGSITLPEAEHARKVPVGVKIFEPKKQCSSKNKWQTESTGFYYDYVSKVYT
jgi:hypothetical protein